MTMDTIVRFTYLIVLNRSVGSSLVEDTRGNEVYAVYNDFAPFFTRPFPSASLATREILCHVDSVAV